jgi:NAD(P)H dehydrogenase (quinone)
MLFVPLGYRNKALMNLNEIHGGSPYGLFFLLLFLFPLNISLGAGTLAGTQGERQVSQLEHQLAQTQGIEFGKLVLRLTSTPTHM